MIDQHPLYGSLTQLLERLSILNHLMSLTDSQIKNYYEILSSSYKNNNVDLSNMISMHRLLLSDVSILDESNKNSLIPVAGIIRRGEEYLGTCNEIIHTYLAYTVAQCYEAFETFLRDTSANYFYTWTPQKKLRNLISMPIEYQNLEEWKAFFRKQWNSTKILQLLRETTKCLVIWEKRNSIPVNFQDWHEVFGIVRHAIVHSKTVLHKEQIINHNINELNEILMIYFPGTWQNDDYVMNFNLHFTRRIIELTGDYAFIVFKALCQEKGINWDIY